MAVGITFTVVMAVVSACARYENDLQNSAFFSGYVLMTCVLFLAGFWLRKRISFFPLGSATTWMQLHIYVGLGATIIFFVHTAKAWPNGIFEAALFLAFVLTSLSGLIGLYLTRSIPKRLSKLREQIIYERIPALRKRVQQGAHQVIVKLLKEAPAEALVDLYLNQLVSYFVTPRGFFYYVLPSSRRRNQLQASLDSMSRFLSSEERNAQQQLKQLVDQRDDLDYHQAQQRRLKLWLFIHLGLTVTLLVLMAFHIVMVHAFSSWA